MKEKAHEQLEQLQEQQAEIEKRLVAGEVDKSQCVEKIKTVSVSDYMYMYFT